MSIVLWPGDTVDVKLHNDTGGTFTARLVVDGKQLDDKIRVDTIHVHLTHPPSVARPDGGSIHELELSVRAANCLYLGGIQTIGQLARMTAKQLMALPNFNNRCLGDVRAELQRLGLDISGAKTPRSKKGTKR